MSKVAVKRPAQCRLMFDDDNCRHQRIDSNIATERYTGHDFNDSTYKKNIEMLIFEELKKKLEEEARRFKNKWNIDLKKQKFLPGNYCWEAESAKDFPLFYAKQYSYPCYGDQPLYSNSDETWVEPENNLKSYNNNNDRGNITPQQTTTTTTDLLSNEDITTESLTNTNNRSIGNPVTTNVCNENAEEADGSLRLIPLTCYKPSDPASDIIDRQRPN